MQLDFIYKGGASKRFHTLRTIQTQDIAAHSFGVAWLCELLTGGQASKNLIMAALAHDLAEHRVGDIPSPVKRDMGVGELFHDYEMGKLAIVGLSKYYDELTEGEGYTLKLADMIDGMMFCLTERNFGNSTIDPVYNNFHLYALQVMKEHPTVEAAAAWSFDRNTAVDILNDIHNEWMED